MNVLKKQIMALDEDPTFYWKSRMVTASDFITKHCSEIINLCKALKNEANKENDNGVMTILKKMEKESFIVNRAIKGTQLDAKDKYVRL